MILNEASRRPSLFPNLGMGVGLRAPHFSFVLENRPRVDWFEVTSENFIGVRGSFGGRPLAVLEKIRAQYPVVCHGVSMSLGSVDPLDRQYLSQLKKLFQIVQPEWVSDHLCWTGVDGKNLHDLLPLPYTEEALGHVVERITQVQDFLGRRFVVENVSSYLSFAHSEMTEWDFLTEVATRADCGILLDVNNIYVSAVNHGFDPLEYLQAIPTERVAQFHLAGYCDNGTHLVDTHDHPVSEPVWQLYEKAVEHFGRGSTLLERDDNIPAFDELLTELARAERIQEKVVESVACGNAALARGEFRPAQPLLG